MRPLHEILHSAVTGNHRRLGAGKQIETLIETLGENRRTHRPDPRCRQFDRQWKPIEVSDDFDDITHVVRPQRIPAGRDGTFDEQARAGASTAIAASQPSSGVASGRTGHTCSPGSPSTSRLVARMVTSGHQFRRRSENDAMVPRRCSQLSRTNNARLPRRYSTRVSSTERCWRCCTSTAVAMAPTVDPGSLTGASSATKTSPSNSSHKSPASRIAIRVLPTPPGPVSVTNRWIRSWSVSRSSSSTRPTNLVVSVGTCRITDRRDGTGG